MSIQICVSTAFGLRNKLLFQIYQLVMKIEDHCFKIY